MAWCSDKDVEAQLESVQGANWGTSDIKERIARAERVIRSRLLAAYGAATITAWTSSTVPNMIKDMNAAWAAMLIKKDYIADYRTSTAEKESTSNLLDSLIKGEAELFDNDGAIISRSGGKVLSSTSGLTRTFTKYHPDNTDFGEGSLDDLGPQTQSSEDYPGEDS